jgi:hypothetical protein
MRDISAVSFDVLIPSGTYGDLFEIIVTVGSDIAVSESTGIVKSGETTSIYADISALERVQYIKIGIRALDGAAESTVDMCINSISIHSQKYNSEELENIVLSGEIIDKTEGSKTETDEKKDNITVAVVLAVSVAVVALLWGWYSVSQKKQNG